MSDLISIDREIVRLSSALLQAVEHFDVAGRDSAKARSAYDLAKAKALLKADGSSRELRESEATISCKDEMLDSRIKENLMAALKERVRALEAVLSAQQSRLRFLDTGEGARLGR